MVLRRALGPWFRFHIARLLLASLTIAAFQVALGAADRVFSIPIDSLKL